MERINSQASRERGVTPTQFTSSKIRGNFPTISTNLTNELIASQDNFNTQGKVIAIYGVFSKKNERSPLFCPIRKSPQGMCYLIDLACSPDKLK